MIATRHPSRRKRLAPIIQELRDAEPADLDGVVDTWVAEMERYATGDYPVGPAEDERARMDQWVSDNC
jgi:hypothetical protein